MLIFVTTKSLLENMKAPMSLLGWSARKIDRVVKSTLSAEAYALSGAVDHVTWLRLMLMLFVNPHMEWQKPESLTEQLPHCTAIVDCKSLFDLISRTATPRCDEHRTTLEALVIKQHLVQNMTPRWVPTNAMLADCLTKPMEASLLREILQQAQYQIYDESKILQEKASQRLLRKQWTNHHTAPELSEKTHEQGAKST